MTPGEKGRTTPEWFKGLVDSPASVLTQIYLATDKLDVERFELARISFKVDFFGPFPLDGPTPFNTLDARFRACGLRFWVQEFGVRVPCEPSQYGKFVLCHRERV